MASNYENAAYPRRKRKPTATKQKRQFNLIIGNISQRNVPLSKSPVFTFSAESHITVDKTDRTKMKKNRRRRKS